MSKRTNEEIEKELRELHDKNVDDVLEMFSEFQDEIAKICSTGAGPAKLRIRLAKALLKSGYDIKKRDN